MIIEATHEGTFVLGRPDGIDFILFFVCDVRKLCNAEIFLKTLDLGCCPAGEDWAS